MRLIKKTVLNEDYTNTKEKEVTTGSKDADYKQAILTAVGSETGAWNEYNTILEMEKDVSQDLVEHFHNTIEDIRNEEMKHVGQLTEKISELPDMKDAYETGKKEAEEGNEESLDNAETEEKQAKEEVKESVQLTESVTEKIPDNTRHFDSDTIFDIILDNFDLTPESEDIIYKLFNEDEELTAEEVDAKLEIVKETLHLSPEHQEILENMIISSKDPVVDRVKEFKSDIENDIGLIKNCIESVDTQAAVSYLQEVISQLETLEYNGEKDIGWLKSNTVYGDHPTKKVIG